MPDVQEGLKWSNPHFDYKGIFCGMSAFKEHVTFGFWKHQLLVDRGLLPADSSPGAAMGKIWSVDDLPSEKELIKIIKAAEPGWRKASRAIGNMSDRRRGR